MIGLDTNVLLRLFIEDDLDQCRRARGFVEAVTAEGPVLVNAIVLSEFVWTLDRALKIGKPKIVHVLTELLSADDLQVEHRQAAAVALAAYRTGQADFPDYYLAAINVELGCASTVTSDSAALTHTLFSPVS
jgi:predicted nucleic-acid-binding protein